MPGEDEDMPDEDKCILRCKNREDPNCLIFSPSRSGFKNANKMKQMRRVADYISDNA